MFDLSDRLTKVEAYQVEEIEGELLMYHAGKGETLFLNEPAAMVWYLCDGEKTVGDIVELLRESYPSSEQAIEDDVQASLKEFYGFGGLVIKKETEHSEND